MAGFVLVQSSWRVMGRPCWGAARAHRAGKAKSFSRGRGLMTLICPLHPAELSTVGAACHGHAVTTGERGDTQEAWFACSRTEPTVNGNGMRKGSQERPPDCSRASVPLTVIKRQFKKGASNFRGVPDSVTEPPTRLTLPDTHPVMLPGDTAFPWPQPFFLCDQQERPVVDGAWWPCGFVLHRAENSCQVVRRISGGKPPWGPW